jgi:predicted ABC-type transport system involved in lysophospholipase L1 biosynthesis ATPase subunit
MFPSVSPGRTVAQLTDTGVPYPRLLTDNVQNLIKNNANFTPCAVFCTSNRHKEKPQEMAGGWGRRVAMVTVFFSNVDILFSSFALVVRISVHN